MRLPLIKANDLIVRAMILLRDLFPLICILFLGIMTFDLGSSAIMLKLFTLSISLLLILQP